MKKEAEKQVRANAPSQPRCIHISRLTHLLGQAMVLLAQMYPELPPSAISDALNDVLRAAHACAIEQGIGAKARLLSRSTDSLLQYLSHSKCPDCLRLRRPTHPGLSRLHVFLATVAHWCQVDGCTPTGSGSHIHVGFAGAVPGTCLLMQPVAVQQRAGASVDTEPTCVVCLERKKPLLGGRATARGEIPLQ